MFYFHLPSVNYGFLARSSLVLGMSGWRVRDCQTHSNSTSQPLINYGLSNGTPLANDGSPYISDTRRLRFEARMDSILRHCTYSSRICHGNRRRPHSPIYGLSDYYTNPLAPTYVRFEFPSHAPGLHMNFFLDRHGKGEEL